MSIFFVKPPLLRSRVYLIVLFLCLCGVGCGKKDDDTVYESMVAPQLYADAKASMNVGDWDQAIKLYKKLEARFPYGYYGKQALVDLAYVYYKAGQADNAIATCNRFLKIHPNNAYADYVYYLKGIVSYYRASNISERLFSTDLTQRDLLSMQEAFQYFSDLIDRYPDSIYSTDARYRLTYLANILAQSEINTAHYYMRRNAFVSALNRATFVLEQYSQARSTADALAIMAKCYRILGMEDLAQDTLRVLDLNFPNHPQRKHIDQIKIL